MRRLSIFEIGVLCLLLLIGLALLPIWLLRQQSASRQIACEDRLRRLAMALQAFDDQQGQLPGYRNVQAKSKDGTQPGTGWVFPVLPYLTSADAAGAQRASQVFNAYGPSGDDALRGRTPTEFLPELICPAPRWTREQRAAQLLSYVANCGLPDADPEQIDADLPPDWQANGLFFNHVLPEPQRVMTSLSWLADHDGLQETILLSENLDAGPWTSGDETKVGFLWNPGEPKGVPDDERMIAPINVPVAPDDAPTRKARPSSQHVHGVNIALADGGTQLLSQDVDYFVYARMLAADNTSVAVPGVKRLLDKPWRITTP